MAEVERLAFGVERKETITLDAQHPTLNAQRLTLNPRLRWRARRGMLENDLILTRFLDCHERELSATQTDALLRLLELPDTELFDLLMMRSEPAPPLDAPELRALLAQLRAA